MQVSPKFVVGYAVAAVVVAAKLLGCGPGITSVDVAGVNDAYAACRVEARTVDAQCRVKAGDINIDPPDCQRAAVKAYDACKVRSGLP